MYIQLAYNKPCKHVNFSLERTASEIWISWGWSKAVAMASFRDKELTCRTSAASISGVHWLAMWEAWLTSRQAHLWGRENHSESLHLVQENRNTSPLLHKNSKFIQYLCILVCVKFHWVINFQRTRGRGRSKLLNLCLFRIVISTIKKCSIKF